MRRGPLTWQSTAQVSPTKMQGPALGATSKLGNRHALQSPPPTA